MSMTRKMKSKTPCTLVMYINPKCKTFKSSESNRVEYIMVNRHAAVHSTYEGGATMRQLGTTRARTWSYISAYQISEARPLLPRWTFPD